MKKRWRVLVIWSNYFLTSLRKLGRFFKPLMTGQIFLCLPLFRSASRGPTSFKAGLSKQNLVRQAGFIIFMIQFGVSIHKAQHPPLSSIESSLFLYAYTFSSHIGPRKRERRTERNTRPFWGQFGTPVAQENERDYHQMFRHKQRLSWKISRVELTDLDFPIHDQDKQMQKKNESGGK